VTADIPRLHGDAVEIYSSLWVAGQVIAYAM